MQNSRYIVAFFLLISSAIPTSTLATTTNWQNPYVGAYAGGGFGNSHVTTNVGGATSSSYFTNAIDINAVNAAGTASNHPSAAIVGIRAGHDWAWKKIAYGVTLDYGTLPLSSSKRVSQLYQDNVSQYSIHTSMSTNWLLTLRGRVGYQAMLQWPSLLYVTGGLAVTQLKVHNDFSDNTAYTGTGDSHTADNQIGWTAGLGIEVLSCKGISLNLEYLYVHVPSVNTMGSVSNATGGFGIPTQSLNSPFATTGKFRANLLTVGLNYRFAE